MNATAAAHAGMACTTAAAALVGFATCTRAGVRAMRDPENPQRQPNLDRCEGDRNQLFKMLQAWPDDTFRTRFRMSRDNFEKLLLLAKKGKTGIKHSGKRFRDRAKRVRCAACFLPTHSGHASSTVFTLAAFAGGRVVILPPLATQVLA